jgi:hypothetical protein
LRFALEPRAGFGAFSGALLPERCLIPVLGNCRIFWRCCGPGVILVLEATAAGGEDR